jgi:hypothetical protein
MSYHVIVKGRRCTVAALDFIQDDWTSTCPALSFLQGSFDDKTTSAACKGYRALFQLLADEGPAGLTPAMMHEANKPNAIMELIKGRLRLLCFIEGDTIFLTNGYLKSTQKADTQEVAKAIKAKDKYFENNPRRKK